MNIVTSKIILKGPSGTRWTDRVASVRPFAKSIPRETTFPKPNPKKSIEVDGALRYLSQFTCVIMSSMWLKILVQIDHTNQVIRARDATIDVEVSNLISL